MQTPVPTATPAGVRGLPLDVLHQLLQDIEDQGGLHNAFQLKALCARKPDVYGMPASAMRRAIQNKTQRLKKMSRESYLELLLSSGIASFQQQQQQRHQMNNIRSGKQSSGIKPKQLRSLLHDIEAQGGRHGIALREICNRKPDMYGAPGSTERRVIQNKVHHLKLLSREAYLKMLATMNIQRTSP